MAEIAAFERVHPLNGGHLHLPAVSGCLDNMTGMESPSFGVTVCLFAGHGHCPLALGFIPLSIVERSGGPYIQLHKAGIGFEPLRQLVLWSKDRPMGREWNVWEMVVPHRVMKDELVVSSKRCKFSINIKYVKLWKATYLFRQLSPTRGFLSIIYREFQSQLFLIKPELK